MAQNISIKKTDEEGKVLEDLQINFADVVNGLERIDDYKNKYIWIATIDPYGETIFNHIQLPFVIEDLKKLQQDKQELISKDMIEKLVNFFEIIENHEYIKFIGD